MVKKLVTKQVDFKETLWKSADKLRNQMDAAEYKHIVLGLVFLKYISDTFVIQRNKIQKMVSDKKSDFFVSEDPKVYEKELEDRDYYTQENVFWVPSEARWEKIRAQAKQTDIGSIIDKAMVKIESENKFLRGKLDKRFGRTQLDEGKLGELIDLISKIGFTNEQKAGDLLGEVYEYFLGQFAIAEGKKGGQFYTPSSIVKTLVNVLSPFTGRIYDPCCGSGGMFIQSQEFVKFHGGKIDDVSIYGQESNPTTWRLAAMNLAIRGFSADLGKTHADTFSKDQFIDKKFDFVLANPHFNDSDWGGEKYQNDQRWKYGKPSDGNANYAWLQHILWKLNKNGRAGIILANGSLTSEDEIRSNMIKDNVVEAIVTLPEKLFVNTGIPVCLWFLNKDNQNKNKVLFIEGKNLGSMKNRTLKVLNEKDIETISKTICNFRKKENYHDVKGFSKVVDSKEVEKNSFILTPSRYVGSLSDNVENELSTNDLNKLRTEYLNEIQNNNNLDMDIKNYLNKIINDK